MLGIPVRQRFKILDMLVKWKNMMKKHTGRKIKVLQIDSVGEYKDQFLRFYQNTGVDIHFTNGIHGVAKKMNHSLLENVWCLLSNTSLDKTL